MREWFAGALAPDEVLVAALATTPFRLTMLNSLVATGRDLVGQNQARILLLADTSIHLTSRKFWRRRLKAVLASYRLGTVTVTTDGDAIVVGDQELYFNPLGVGAGIGSGEDLQLLLDASAPG